MLGRAPSLAGVEFVTDPGAQATVNVASAANVAGA
jgi:hypothetical protein